MKKLLVLFLVSLLALTACSKKEEAATDAKADATADAKAEEAPAAENDPFKDMERTREALDAMLKDKSPEEENALLMQAAKHPDAALRTIAFEREPNGVSESKDIAFAYINILKEEKNVDVLDEGLRSLVTTLPLDPAIVDFYREAAKHADPKVRTAAAVGLLDVKNVKNGIAFTVDDAIKLLDDEDINVRRYVCENVSKAFPDAKLIPVYETMILGAEGREPVEPFLLSSCITGLISMWYNGETYMPEAFDLTMKYLEHTPRTKDWPCLASLTKFSYAPKKSWVKIATDFDGKKLMGVMKDIAKDDNAKPDSRVLAVKAVGVYGTKADVEELNSIENEKVKNTVAQVLENMK